MKQIFKELLKEQLPLKILKTLTILKFHYLLPLQYKLRETRNTEPKANSITAIRIAKKLKSNYVGDSPTSNDASYSQT